MCIVWVHCLSVKNLWFLGKGRIEGGASGRQKEFWDGARHGGFTWEELRRQMCGTGNQPHGRISIRINRIIYDLVREKPSNMAKVFVNRFVVRV